MGYLNKVTLPMSNQDLISCIHTPRPTYGNASQYQLKPFKNPFFPKEKPYNQNIKKPRSETNVKIQLNSNYFQKSQNRTPFESSLFETEEMNNLESQYELKIKSGLRKNKVTLNGLSSHFDSSSSFSELEIYPVRTNKESCLFK